MLPKAILTLAGMDKFRVQCETVSIDEKWRVTGAFPCMCTYACTLTHAKVNACILTHSLYSHIYMYIYADLYVSICKCVEMVIINFLFNKFFN